MSSLPPFHYQWNRSVCVIHSEHKHTVCDICSMWGHLRKINLPWWCWGWLQNLFTALQQWRRPPDSLWWQLLSWWNGLPIKSCGSEDATTLTLHTSLINVLTSEFCCCSRGMTESVFCICWNMPRGWIWGDFIGVTSTLAGSRPVHHCQTCLITHLSESFYDLSCQGWFPYTWRSGLCWLL